MEIKGAGKDLYAAKDKLIFIGWLGNSKEIPYEKIKRIEYYFAPKFGSGFIIFITRTNEKTQLDFKIKYNDEILKLTDILKKKYPHIEFVEHEEKPSTTQHAPIVQSASAPPPKADNGLKCPKCHSHNIDLWADDKNYKVKQRTSVNLNPLHPLTVFETKEVKKEKKSAAKIGLAVATGGTSLLLTGTKKKAHNEYYCRDCGYRWTGK